MQALDRVYNIIQTIKLNQDRLPNMNSIVASGFSPWIWMWLLNKIALECHYLVCAQGSFMCSLDEGDA